MRLALTFLFSCACAFGQYAPARPMQLSMPAGLIGYWRGDGANPNDSSYNGLVVTNFGAKCASGPGLGAYQFTSASSNYLGSASTSLGSLGTGDQTFSAWIYTFTTNAAMHIIAKDSASSRAFAFEVHCDNSGTTVPGWITAFWTDGSQFLIGYVNVNTIMASNWYHVAAIRSGLTNVTFYVNGNIQSTAYTLRQNVNVNKSGPITIARRDYSGFQQYFNGWMAQVEMHSRALSEAEIQAKVQTYHP